jgi:ABC-2 type transport system permease protein
MKRILSQCRKELAQFQRDRLTVALAFLLPLMTLLIFGFAIRLEAKNIPILIQDYDQAALSRNYSSTLFSTQQFNPVSSPLNAPINTVLDNGTAKAVVIIPPDFSRHLAASKTADIQVLVDGTDVNNARIIKNSIKATTQSFMQQEGLVPDTQPIRTHPRIWFNPGRKEALYIVPGVYAVVLWIFPALLSAVAMVREKEKETILQVYASSLSAAEYLLGKELAYLVVGLGMAAFIITLGTLIFGLAFAGDLLPFLVTTPVYLGTSVMFGLLIGARSNNQNAAVQQVSLIGFLTAFLLSGFIYPLSNIPYPLSLLPNVVPARYYIEVMRDAFVRGIGWSGVGFDLLMIGVLGFVFFMAARRVLRRMQLPD